MALRLWRHGSIGGLQGSYGRRFASNAAGLLCLLLVSCAGAPKGARVSMADLAHAAVTGATQSASTEEAEGLRVLWNGWTRGDDFESRGWIAGTSSELLALWEAVGQWRRPPLVDFSKYVVFGVAGGGRKCPSEVTHVTVESHDILRLYTAPDKIICEDVRVRIAQVVAVPRRLLGTRSLLISGAFRDAFDFSIPNPGTAPAVARSALGNQAVVSPGADRITLPPAGHISLRTLRDGSEVWVTHDRDGAVSVLSASVSLASGPPQWADGVERYLSQALTWEPGQGRFYGGYDAHGRNVHGFRALRGYAWARSDHDNDQIIVGGPIEIPPGPIQPRAKAPILDGDAAAYSRLQAMHNWSALRDGQVASLDLDLVFSPTSGARLCRAPRLQEALGSFVGCSSVDPVVAGYPAWPVHFAHIRYGPLVVRRRGSVATVISINLSQLRVVRDRY